MRTALGVSAPLEASGRERVDDAGLMRRTPSSAQSWALSLPEYWPQAALGLEAAASRRCCHGALGRDDRPAPLARASRKGAARRHRPPGLSVADRRSRCGPKEVAVAARGDAEGPRRPTGRGRGRAQVAFAHARPPSGPRADAATSEPTRSRVQGRREIGLSARRRLSARQPAAELRRPLARGRAEARGPRSEGRVAGVGGSRPGRRWRVGVASPVEGARRARDKQKERPDCTQFYNRYTSRHYLTHTRVCVNPKLPRKSTVYHPKRPSPEGGAEPGDGGLRAHLREGGRGETRPLDPGVQRGLGAGRRQGSSRNLRRRGPLGPDDQLFQR